MTNANRDAPFYDFDGVENVTIKNETMQTIRVVFQRDSPFWDNENGDRDHNDRTSLFPTKNALLPYGAKVKAHLRKRNPDNKSGCKHEVCSWEIIDDPRSIAYEDAKLRSNMSKDVCSVDADDSQNDGSKNSDEEGVYLHKYLKSRGDYYLKYNNYGDKKKVKKQRNPLQGTDQASHGDKKAKSYRAKIFASWLVDEFGPSLLNQCGGILDIAGGKGTLSVELSILMPDVQCTVIDPFIRCRSADGKFLPNKEMKRIQRVNGTPPKHLAKYFKNNDESNDAVETCSCVVGLHPDQPTEDIVDIALEKNKPFAVIPCCVFPCLFPMRLLSSGKNVVHYEDFMQYLLEKDDRLKETTLNFEGKNRLIYFKG
mmetsp:Transcript_13765/g.20897  ORF Transcript_13765/g.20897 Transcript_13765/m.20897 type:complete len:369 (+) Transcript_13765:1-1107(+)